MVLVISNPHSFKFKSEEIILTVFANLDSPTQFICTSRYFASLGCSPRFIAHWIIRRYGKSCALYCALTKHSEICDDKLIQCLIALQVNIPRYLLQMLIENYRGPRRTSLKSSHSSQSSGKLSAFSDAIGLLPFSGYAAIINTAFEKYGDVFPSEENDFMVITRLLGEIQNGNASEEKQQQLDQIILDKQFSPLPLPEQMMPKCLFRLAVEDSRLFKRISPAFYVDKHARFRVWEWAILDAIDNSFSPLDKISARKLKQLECISMYLEELPLGGIKEEREIFILAMVGVFKRYPSGYISSSVIYKAFHLIDKYVRPNLADMIVKDDIEINQDISPVIQQGFSKFMAARIKN
ncbi:hypothetical protein BGW37DRAFT_493735 [Umbelopsis sp. PMI_123]|nr:hypothetical protein BGW37DRAFT_493735 [Umbelopsis sp. PMI_123]